MNQYRVVVNGNGKYRIERLVIRFICQPDRDVWEAVAGPFDTKEEAICERNAYTRENNWMVVD